MNFERRPVRVSGLWRRLAKQPQEWVLFKVAEDMAWLVAKGEHDVDVAREMLMEAAEAYGVMLNEGRQRCDLTISNAFRRVLGDEAVDYGPWLAPGDPRGWHHGRR
jgi:hypothetical protein